MGKFAIYCRNNRIPEWRDYYINYVFLKSILQKLDKFGKKTTTILMEELISDMTKEESEYLESLQKEFENNLLEEVKKFNIFFKFIFNNSIKVKFFKIVLNLETNKKRTYSYKIKNQNKKIIKEATERYYKEISNSIRYIELNMMIIYKLQKR